MSIEILRATRKSLKDRGVVANETLSAVYLETLQDIRRRMNAAKVAAISAAEKPFLEELQEAEEEYAMFLKLAS